MVYQTVIDETHSQYKDFCRKCSSFLLNDFKGILNKKKISLKSSNIPPEVIGMFIEWEILAINGWDRRKTREAVNELLIKKGP